MNLAPLFAHFYKAKSRKNLYVTPFFPDLPSNFIISEEAEGQLFLPDRNLYTDREYPDGGSTRDA